MPDFVDNCAGYSAVTGTADYLMSATGTGKHLRLDQALIEAQSVAYYAIGEASGVDAFESGVAHWDDALNTLVVDTITNSSNGGGKISWDAGDKTIYIVANSATMVSTEDPRLIVDDVDDMTAATSLDGTENIAASQGGDPVRLTPLQILGTTIAAASSVDGTETLPALDGSTVVRATLAQVLGDPYRQNKTLALTRSRGFSNFDRLHISAVIANLELVGNEPYVLHASGAAAEGANGTGAFFVPSIQLSTGSTNTGYAVITHTDVTYFFVAGSTDLDQRWNVAFPILPTNGVQDFTIQIGFINGSPSLAVQGIYFELTGASANWFKCVKNGSGTTRVDTGIACVANTPTTLRVAYSASATESQFWVDGVSSAAIDDATRVVGAFIPLAMVAGIRKTAGGTARTMGCLGHLYDNKREAIPHFA